MKFDNPGAETDKQQRRLSSKPWTYHNIASPREPGSKAPRGLSPNLSPDLRGKQIPIGSHHEEGRG